MRSKREKGINPPPANGSWNIYKTVLEYDGLVDNAYALEIETEWNWSQPVIVSLDTLSSVIPIEAATLLVAMIQSIPEPETVLYGDNIDIPKVYGWSLEFSVVNTNPLPTAIGGNSEPRKGYEVIESRVWMNDAGRTVSIYGALPYRTEQQKQDEGWKIVCQGWTVRNPFTNEIGIGRVPWKTQAEAEEWALSHVPNSRSMYD